MTTYFLHTFSGPEVLFKTCVAIKFVDDDDDGDLWEKRLNVNSANFVSIYLS